MQWYIESLIKQLSKIANSYKVVRHHVEKDNKYNIYFAYTYSKILYGIEVYGSTYFSENAPFWGFRVSVKTCQMLKFVQISCGDRKSWIRQKLKLGYSILN